MDHSTRVQTYAANQMVLSTELNGIQDRDIDIMKKVMDGVAAFMALGSDAADKTITYLYFDSGDSGTFSADGAGELARVTLSDGKTID